MQTNINKLTSDEKGNPEHCWKLERWQGPPHTNKVKQYETLLFFKLCRPKESLFPLTTEHLLLKSLQMLLTLHS